MAEHTLICWQSVNHGNDVLMNSLALLSNRRIAIKKVILLRQSDNIIDIQTDRDVQLEQIQVHIGDDPTNHQKIYQALCEQILPRIASIQNLHINISPGTPAMHAVWLILHAGGRLPNGARLWSSQFNPQTQRHSIREVDFPINTYLSEIHQLKRQKTSWAIYDAEPKSVLRERALADLKKFSQLSDIPLLICGEQGIGKSRLVESLVQIIKQKEVIAIACGALDEHNADRILFGNKNEMGLLEKAHQNILFFDEVQDLPKSVQRKLLRVLQEKERKFRPTDDVEEKNVIFDVVCTSHHSPAELANILEKDFFDRISLLSVHFPPLRDCREDLLDDWQQVWNELRMPNFPSKAPTNQQLIHFLNTSALSDNFRDLQKLVCLIMAYWQENDVQAALNQALEVINTGQNPLFASTGEMIVTGVTRLEMLNQFKKEIAINAKNRYGTWRKAAEALDCDEKTLRQDANL
ncbi:sigma 54-interacting transcriptional regulator [Moraxella oblonga]|uniref:sigma 54-interacting transcriptional regulator n=1 Tax=Moraxella oblonga TaxID=200413 RepID=UPI000830ACDD|nr:sigma 54-interacting transcriptional regulator [Moraxella oblonga]